MLTSNAQEKLPYYEIPNAPEKYTSGTVVGRMIDGLGFRFYWATEGLRTEDLVFKPSEEARTSRETLEHIYGLTSVILKSVTNEHKMDKKASDLNFDELRKEVLVSLKIASDILKESNDISEFKIIFERGENTTEFPFWNQINGPISDAIWHTGQIVTFRRSSGNPFNSKASLFTGKLRE